MWLMRVRSLSYLPVAELPHRATNYATTYTIHHFTCSGSASNEGEWFLLSSLFLLCIEVSRSDSAGKIEHFIILESFRFISMHAAYEGNC